MGIRVFFSYSHEDEQHRDQLEKHLSLMRRQGLIETWHDRRILAGEQLDGEIGEEVNHADIVLLLVSANFLASDYCYSREMTRALERQQRGEARVVPVIVRDCDWHSAPFGGLKAVPTDGKPIVSWVNFDAAYTNVAKEIRRLVGVVRKTSSATVRPRAPHDPGAPEAGPDRLHKAPASSPRSGDLRVRQNFSDREMAIFLRETFEYIARFFDNSLLELAQRHQGLETDWRRVDANRFTAVIYVLGEHAVSCSVRMEGGDSRDGGILYAADLTTTSSYNERVSVSHDDQSLFLRVMGMGWNGRGRDENLTPEGAAEVLWSLLIEPLQ